MLHIAWIIPILPFFACAVLIFFGSAITRRIGEKVGWIGVAGIAATIPFSLGCLAELIVDATPYEVAVPWAAVGSHAIHVGYLVDPLTAVMICMVSIVATCIMVYSTGYMHGDPRFARFFAYMSLFCGSMFLICIANNFLMLYAGWELVGLCSYLLIGFWFERQSASNAAKKAFITTRIGDVGFAIGILIIFSYVPSLLFADTFAAVHSGAIPAWIAGIAAAFLFCGAIGKSAQFPLHVWLPDAMEGPTPVSALIHAATMVAAGVFMVARLFPLFFASLSATVIFGAPALTIVAVIGLITALLGAVIGVVQNDIKRVLAYSTISQLGYMMVGLGMGVAGFTAAVFHLITHAFFKSLLFLGSGSVIHGCHEEQDIQNMGGLAKKMPITYVTFWAGTLALAGFPLFAGFFSKDEILLSAWNNWHENGSSVFFWGLEIGAFLTAFYMGRLCFLTFSGKPRTEAAETAHESPKIMTVPLVILALFAVFLGWVGTPWVAGNLFHQFVHPPVGQTILSGGPASPTGLSGLHEAATNWTVIGISTLMAVGGLFVAALLYLWQVVPLGAITWPVCPTFADFAPAAREQARALCARYAKVKAPERLEQALVSAYARAMYQLKVVLPDSLRRPLHPIYLLVKNKFYFDEVYAVVPVGLTLGLAWGSRLVDNYVVDGIVNAVGWGTRWLLAGAAWVIDTFIVDGLVNLAGYVSKWTGELTSRLQTGRVQEYVAGAVMFACGIAAVVFVAVFLAVNDISVVAVIRRLFGG